jgi:uncharacterized alkaline shock family protein YloU
MMKGSMSTDLGIITVSPDVIAKYAGSVAIECFGIGCCQCKRWAGASFKKRKSHERN